MIIAAVLPGPWSAIVIADEGVVLHRDSWEVGAIVGGVRSWIPAAFADRVADLCCQFNVSQIVLDFAEAREARSHELSGAVTALLPHTEYARPGWRERGRILVSSAFDWVPSPFKIQNDCAALLADAIITTLKVPPRAIPTTRHATPPPPSDNPIAIDIPKPPSLPAIRGPRYAGVDPGSGKIGLVIAEGGQLPLHLILKKSIPVGERVKLKKARKFKRGDREVTISTRHSLTAAHLDQIRTDVAELLKSAGVDTVAMEHAESAYLPQGRSGAALATALLKTALVDEAIRGACMAAGIKVVQVHAATWRAKIAGRKKRGGAGAELIPEGVQRSFANWPAASDEHERDAAGIVAWLVDSFTPPKVVIRTRAKTVQAPTKKAIARTVRTASGCVCKSKRHRVGCPMKRELVLE